MTVQPFGPSVSKPIRVKVCCIASSVRSEGRLDAAKLSAFFAAAHR